MSTYRLRRFAGFTPHNAVDRIRDARDAARRVMPAPPRWHYGMQTWDNLFRAFSTFRGVAYRAGDATRRQRR